LAEVKKEQVDLAHLEQKLWPESQALVDDLLRSSNPETPKLVSLVAKTFLISAINERETVELVHVVVGMFGALTPLLKDFIGDTVSHLASVESRLNKLEKKADVPSPELAKLRLDVTKTQAFLDEHKDTLEELEVLRGNKIQQWIRSLDESKRTQEK
jgi:hypothetical protein